MKLERSFSIVVAMMWKDIQERPYEIQRFSCNIGDLEDRAYPLGNELSGGIDTLLLVLDENWDLPRARTFQYFGDLLNCLLQDLGRTNIDFGDDNHDWDVQSQGNTQVLFTHTNETIIGSHHQQTVIWA